MSTFTWGHGGPALDAEYSATTFVDQDGIIWDMACAECPKCATPAKLESRTWRGGFGYLFACTGCDLIFDEPHWDGEAAFLGSTDDENEA